MWYNDEFTITNSGAKCAEFYLVDDNTDIKIVLLESYSKAKKKLSFYSSTYTLPLG